METVERQPRATRVDQASVEGTQAHTVHNPTPGRDAFIVSLLVIAGLLVRLDFMRAAQFTIDGDEAIVGLMGKHIIEGRGIPTFYYGQHYMGSLEAIMASLSFWLFGISPFTLQLVPLVWSLALIPVMYLLGRSIVSRVAGLVAASLVALPAPALIVWSSKARGGFIEVVVLGAIALLIMIAWIRDHPERLRYPLTLGLVLGLGWWVNNQIVYFIVPVSIYALMHSLSRSMRLVRARDGKSTTVGWERGVARIVAVGTLGFFVGGFPYWAYNIRNGFPSFGMFSVAKGDGILEHLSGLFETALPMIVGAQRFWQKNPVFPGAQFLALALYGLPFLALVWMRRRELVGLFLGNLDRRQPIELVLLFCVTCCVVFSASSFGWLVQAPRYLLPLYVGLYLVVATVCALLFARERRLGAVYLVALLCFQLAASCYGGRAITGEPVVFGGQRVARDHEPLIAALDMLGIRHVRTNYWIGYRLAFETEERVTFSVLGEPDEVRIPEYEQEVTVAPAVVPLVLVQAEANLVKPALQRQGFAFSEMRAGEYTVLYDIKELFRLGVPLNVSQGRDLAEAPSGLNPWAALDGDILSRWGSAKPQEPGQVFSLTLGEPKVISAIQYKVGQWRGDLPRELKVELEDEHGQRSVVLSPMEWRGLRHITLREGDFTLRFLPRSVQKIILSQQGSDRVVDWSIAELTVFEDPAVRINSGR
jgi:hypothetical protein